MNIRAATPALAAALLFGASTPLDKLLLGFIHHGFLILERVPKYLVVCSWKWRKRVKQT